MNNTLCTTTVATPGRAALYAPPSFHTPIDLRLHSNECAPTLLSTDVAAMCDSVIVGQYPSAARLECAVANRWGTTADCVIVTAGGDEAIDRACRAFLSPGRELILPIPTFEMIARYARLAGAEVNFTDWTEGVFPIDQVLGRVNERTAMIAVVSPNNPTGAVATAADLRRLAEAAPRAVLLVDCAYGEFADEDLTATAITLPNAVVIRTFSKAFGLAGLRVGYALGSPLSIHAMRIAGSPYPVSGASLAAAEVALTREQAVLPSIVTRVRRERGALFDLLVELGAGPQPSQGNFVLAECSDPEWVWRGLGALGIGVRRFAPDSGLASSLRIGCPCSESGFERLSRALRSALRPEAVLLDLDGVIADVSESYRRAIALTAESFGTTVSPQEIAAAKAEGNANNDWIVTHRLLARRGVDASFDEVVRRFEALYHGSGAAPGLKSHERLIPDRTMLERLAERWPLAIVTGRPRRDCEEFLSRLGLSALFRAVVCMEDAPLKPDPAPVRLALARLGVQDAWMVGDTPDDVAAARAAGVIPLGILPQGTKDEQLTESIQRAGAARVLGSLSELEEILQ